MYNWIISEILLEFMKGNYQVTVNPPKNSSDYANTYQYQPKEKHYKDNQYKMRINQEN